MSDARVVFYRAKLKLIQKIPNATQAKARIITTRGFIKKSFTNDKIKPTPRWVFVSLAQQKLFAYRNRTLVKEYICSTSLKPPSCQYGSNGTPLGLHRVAEKIGEGAPWGAIFEKREFAGKLINPAKLDEKSLITTRILWLEGLEEGKNHGYECGSHNRKIYIHGTNHEGKVGSPHSCGCVELKNDDIIDLFERVQPGDHVVIE